MAEDDKSKESLDSKKKKNKSEKVYNNTIEVNPSLEEENVEEALTRQQRRQRAITMRRFKSKIAAGRRKASRRVANMDTLKKRARRKAISAVRQKVASKSGAKYKDLDPTQKMIIDKKVAKRQAVVDRIAKKLLPQVRKSERDRLNRKSSTNESFEAYLESFENPPTKRFHEVRKKDGSIKLDRRFRAFKNAAKPMTEADAVDRLRDTHKAEREDLKREHEREMDTAKSRELRGQIRKINRESVEVNDDRELLALIESVSEEVYQSIKLDESKVDTALEKKSDKSGIAYGILKDVYDRGVAAWETTKRKNTTPAQWGMARVNSFISGGKTRTTADADLWKKHSGEEDVKEGLWDNIHAKRKRIKAGSGERMRKPGSKGAPTAQDFKDASEGVDLSSFFDLNEQFELMEAPTLEKALAAIHKHVQMGKDLNDMAFQVSRAKDVEFSTQELRRKYIAKFGDPEKSKVNPEVRSKLMKKFGFKEQYGAGFQGTDTATQNFKADTPGENGTRKKPKISDWSPNIKDAPMPTVTEAEDKCQLIGLKQIKEFEKIVDKLFEKYGLDFNFTRHFGERMSDERNTPCISMKELAEFIKKMYKNQGKSIKGVAGAEAVLKDIQSNLNIPVAVEYDRKNDEFDVVMKTIMRKKDFKTPNKVIKY